MFEQTKYFNIGRKSFLIWRFIQLWIFCNILILEIIQVLGYSQYYWRHPANDQARVWIIEGISFAIIGYLLINFNRRWKVGPAKDDIILDWILLIIWSIQCFLNLTPSLVGNGFDCNITTSPYNIKTRDEQSRCYLFISSTIISFVALFITLITLILSITRWKNRKFLQLSMNSYNMRSQKSYLVQEGSLENGEPVLLFYSKSKSLNGGIHGKMIRNPIAKSKRVSPSPINPINITISEPEIAAAAYHSKEIPNDEEKYDDSILKY